MTLQEGKNIASDFYIIAVYDDPASATISFSAFIWGFGFNCSPTMISGKEKLELVKTTLPEG